MASIIKIKSAAKVREEEELLAKAKKICVEQPRTTDRTDYEKAVEAFTTQTLVVRKYLNEKYPEFAAATGLTEFKAAFEEVPIVLAALTGQGSMHIEDEDLKMFMQLVQVVDQYMEYEARALKIPEPRSWYYCWAKRGEMEYPYTDDQNYQALKDLGIVKADAPETPEA